MTLQERLRANVMTHSRAMYTAAADRIDALERENATLRKDAERYRWMRTSEWRADWIYDEDGSLLCEGELDAAIDAAMAQHNGGQGGNIAGDGRNPLPGVAYAGQGWKR